MALYDLGILGGGQLARMSAQAAQRMGLTVLVLDPSEDACAAGVTDSLVGRLDDPAAIAALFGECARATFENEFVPADAVEAAFEMADFEPDDLVPSVACLRLVQDKLAQRRAYEAAGIPGPRAVELEKAEGPGVAKSRFGGYDGKGVRFVDSPSELDVPEGTWMWEERVSFVRELSAMVVVQGSAVAVSDVVVTENADAVCDVTFPAGGHAVATETAIRAAKVFRSDGLFGVEMFELADGRVFVNEIAPRPHNTGHWTMEGGSSQFEQHVRVAMGMPIEPAFANPPWTMANLLGGPGDDFRDGLWRALALDPSARVHWYGKSVRPGRKVGHINVPGADPSRARRVREAFLGK